MERHLILIREDSEFDELLDLLTRRGMLKSAVAPCLIETPKSLEAEALNAFPSASRLRELPPEGELKTLPLPVQLALAAWLAPVSTQVDASEGLSWDAPGYEAPGRPTPADFE